jgi:hypothetical protein
MKTKKPNIITEDITDKILTITNNKKNKKTEYVNEIKNKYEKTNKQNTKNKLLKYFNIDNRFTEKKHKLKYDSFDENTFPKEDYNFSADLLFLPPYRGYKYLLVVVDNWSNEIEFEQIKTKPPDVVLRAFNKIIKREHMNKPKASIRVDAGTEFKGVFKKYMFEEDILLRVAMTGRHKQNAKAESAIKLISFLIINYLNIKEIELQKNYRNWIELLPSLRNKLNELRKRPDEDPYTKFYKGVIFKLPKFNIGDNVVHLMSKPVDALNKKQSSENRRVGDYIYSYHNPKKIVKILYYSNNVRYMLDGIKNASFTEDEILIYRQINTITKNIK